MNESWEKFARDVCDETGAKWVLKQALVFTFKAGGQERKSEWQINPDEDVGKQTQGDLKGYDEMDTWVMVVDGIEDIKQELEGICK